MVARSCNKSGARLVLGVIVVTGCGGRVEDAELDLASVGSPLGSVTASAGCDPAASAGEGWSNTFFPQSSSSFDVLFRAYPQGSDSDGRPLIDGVVGLSDGPASGFGSLGPIIRFNPWGNIDARDGDVYAGGFPYKTAEPHEFRVSVDVPSRSYSVWVRHLDAIAKPFELLADRFAFRNEQSTVSRLDNVGRFVDSAQGKLQTCGFRYAALTACSASRAGAWLSQAFPPRNGRFKIELDALAAAGASGAIDAVIGAASGAPATFSSLAAIVRFRPDGTLDARNGSSYAADASFAYDNATSYHITFDIEPARGRYSVFVKDPTSHPDAAPTVLAHDYAFRTEQAAVASLDHVGQFVDSAEGTIDVCSLTIVY
jgi:hypothetical protein